MAQVHFQYHMWVMLWSMRVHGFAFHLYNDLKCLGYNNNLQCLSINSFHRNRAPKEIYWRYKWACKIFLLLTERTSSSADTGRISSKICLRRGQTTEIVRCFYQKGHQWKLTKALSLRSQFPFWSVGMCCQFLRSLAKTILTACCCSKILSIFWNVNST